MTRFNCSRSDWPSGNCVINMPNLEWFGIRAKFHCLIYDNIFLTKTTVQNLKSNDFSVQIWLVSQECFVVNQATVSYLVSYYYTVGHKKNNSFKSRSNQITSRLNFPGWEKWQYWMFKSLYSVNYPYIKRLKCPLLISIQTLYIFWTTVLHANSHITLARPVLTREPARRLTLSKPIFPRQSMNSRTTIDPVHF